MLRAFSSTLSFIAKDKSINNSFRLLSTTKRLLVLNNLAPNPGSRRTVRFHHFSLSFQSYFL